MATQIAWLYMSNIYAQNYIWKIKPLNYAKAKD